jgi:hypothetical protein
MRFVQGAHINALNLIGSQKADRPLNYYECLGPFGLRGVQLPRCRDRVTFSESGGQEEPEATNRNVGLWLDSERSIDPPSDFRNFTEPTHTIQNQESSVENQFSSTSLCLNQLHKAQTVSPKL